ncbi:porin [Halomonas sp. HNIBRBA4712]|uniref:porin n=1 Tax=Halomonas sp. HNIBRBA4712 TaxID=3373087 RepID=UPI003744B848
MLERMVWVTLVGLFTASGARAALVYDEGETSVDIYGRLATGIEGGGPSDGVNNDAAFADFGSRLGFRLSQRLTRDVSAFGHLEWRFDSSRQDQPGFDELRQSYMGLESDRFGTFTAGNFDSVYDNFVMSVFDVYVGEGYEFAGDSLQARGDSIGYQTPELNGFQAVLAVKHFSERGLTVEEQTDRGSGFSSQGGVGYQAGPMRLALGFVDDDVRGGGNNQTRLGSTLAYEPSDDMLLRLGFESRGDSDVYGGGFERYGVGATYTIGSLSLNGDYYNIDPDDSRGSRNAWALGTLYKLSEDFDTFAELYNADRKALSDTDTDDVYYAVGARYYF